ncbi:MAG: hypothetical protein JW940_22295 [Polyangiaceae bacterium]|nr:hypothetical protein [Polyangiaceae bacterium]
MGGQRASAGGGATGGNSSHAGQDSGGTDSGAAADAGVESGGGATGGNSSHAGQGSGGTGNSTAGGGDSGKETGGTATGGTLSAAGGAGADGDPPVTGITVSNGYATGYGFQGYWSTWADVVAIDPECPSPCFENGGGSVCVQGTVPPPPAGSTSHGVQSAVTWNLNQSMEESPMFDGLNGLTVDLSSYSILRIGIEQRSGEGTRFFAGVFSAAKKKTLCGPVAPAMDEIHFQDLETLCMGSGDEPLTEEDLQNAVAVVVIALSEQPSSFDFCITHVSFE